MSTPWEELESAVLSLARSGAIKDRLAEAYRNHLVRVNEDELPEALRAEFRACHDVLTRVGPLPGEDAVRATVRKLSNREADDVACRVVRLFAAAVREVALEAARAVPETTRSGSPASAGTVRAKVLGVPQVISLYPADSQSSLHSIVSRR
jgi:hypothetical protein